MRVFVGIFLLTGIFACSNSGNETKEVDTLSRKQDTTLNSATVDSIRAKSKKILDSVKSKGKNIIEKAEEKFNDLKDTTK